MERNYKEIVNSVIDAKERALRFENSRNAVHGLVDLDKRPLDKIEWYPKSVLTKSCKFTFELGDGIINEFYDKHFSYDEYFEKNRGISLPIKKVDFSIIIKIQDCIRLKDIKIAKVGIKSFDIFKNTGLSFDYLDKKNFCLKCFEALFARLLNDSKYYNIKEKSIDIGIVIIDVLERLPEEVNKYKLMD